MSETIPMTSYQSVRYRNKIVQLKTFNHHGIECLFFDDVCQSFPKVTCLYIDDKQQTFLRNESGQRFEPPRVEAYTNEIMDAFEPEESFRNNDQCLQIDHIQELQNTLVLMNNNTQEKIKQAMTLMYELNEYTTPRHFFILKVENDNQGIREIVNNLLQHEYKLYFLCDCSDDPNERHSAPHDGYLIKEPAKLIADYGSYIRTTLNIIKTALPIIGHIIGLQIHKAPALISEVASSLDTCTLMTKINEVENLLDQAEEKSFTTSTSKEVKAMSHHLPLHGAPLRELVNYLEGVDNKNSLGNLYKKITDDGHVRWVCLEHYDTNYYKQRMYQCIRQLKDLGGIFDENTKELIITSDNYILLDIPKLNNLLKNGFKITKFIIKKCSLKESELNRLFDICINQPLINLVFSDVKIISDVNIINEFLKSNYICKSVSISFMEDSLEIYLPNRYTDGDMKTIIQFLLQNNNRRIIKICGIDKFINYENNFTQDRKKESKILIVNHLNNIEILNQIFSSTISFTHIKLNYCYGSSTNFLHLCDLLAKHSTLIELDLINSTGFDDEEVLCKLFKLLNNNKVLKTLDLHISNLHISERNRKERYLIDLIRNNNGFVIRLLLLDSNITPEFAKAIIEKFKNNPESLKSPEWYNCQMNKDIRSNFLHLSMGNKFMFRENGQQYYCVTSKRIQELIGKEFDQEKSLEIEQEIIDEHLNLNEKKLTDKDMIILSNNEKRMKQCKQISLNNCQITSFGILILADILFNNISLEKLYLNSNNLCDGGIYLLTKIFINKKKNLQQLHLKSNEITDEGIYYLVQILKINKTLTHLDLSDNYITDHGLRKLTQTIDEEKINLKSLLLDGNKQLTDTSVSSLISMIKKSTSMENLSLIDCNIHEKSKNKLKEIEKIKKNIRLDM
ncbi:unnamed protein product [Adineta steineri]|uniref:Uncharacterized protein n=1 Tax=Adineta steineri TaxID=433720 RepID=A0A819U9M5_9BILA|nr:unnamed protein product [Adineta steineri]CAF4093674.1 unnamed protein product [Adineta steineri]